MYEWGLIDLKRLHDDVEYWEQHDDPKQPDYDTRDIEDVINRQPIVEAIPVEWLDMFMQRYKIQGNDEYKLLHFMVTEWKKWEKENEIYNDTKAVDTKIHG